MSFRTKAALGALSVSRKGFDIAGLSARAQTLHREGQVTAAQALYRRMWQKYCGEIHLAPASLRQEESIR
jgi:hypothetical protein